MVTQSTQARQMTEKEWQSLVDERYREYVAKQGGIDPLVTACQEAMLALNGVGQANYWWGDPREKIYDSQNSLLQTAYPATLSPNRGMGEDLPVQITETELMWLRNISRVLCATNEYAASGLENRINYIIGEGLQYKVKAIEGAPNLGSLVRDAQALIDLFCEMVDLSDIEEEWQVRNDIDGESFLRLFPQSDGSMKVRFVEPEWVRSVNGNSPQCSYGIETDPDDVQTVLRYWVCPDPFTNAPPEPIDPAFIMHSKIRVMRSSKRGRPLFYPVFTNLKRIEALGKSISAIAVARAKIAMIRRMKNATQDAGNALKEKVTSVTATDPITGKERNIEEFKDGSIVNANDLIDYEFPSANISAGEFIAVFQQELRGVAASLNMPEWMLTSNSENMGAYTSSLVSEAPMNRSIKRWQKRAKNFFARRRINPNMSLLWRYLCHCAALGMVDQKYFRWIEIEATCPSLETRDLDRQANRHKTYFDIGVMTKPEIRAEIGLDPNAVFQKALEGQTEKTDTQNGQAGDDSGDDPFESAD
jgi:hypothetical protein